MKEIKIKFEINSACPYCGFLMESIGVLDHAIGGPEPEDITVCTQCLNMLTFTKDMKLQKMSVETYSHIVTNKEIMDRITMARFIIELHRAWVARGKPGSDPSKNL
jgi:hypothetical protein